MPRDFCQRHLHGHRVLVRRIIRQMPVALVRRVERQDRAVLAAPDVRFLGGVRQRDVREAGEEDDPSTACSELSVFFKGM